MSCFRSKRCSKEDQLLVFTFHVLESSITCLNLFCTFTYIFWCCRSFYVSIEWGNAVLLLSSRILHNFNLSSNDWRWKVTNREGGCGPAAWQSTMSVTGVAFFPMNYFTSSRSQYTCMNMFLWRRRCTSQRSTGSSCSEPDLPVIFFIQLFHGTGVAITPLSLEYCARGPSLCMMQWHTGK